MASHHDWGLDNETWCGGTPDDELPVDLPTCIHAEKGLCPACAEEYREDPAAWLEFGAHPAGCERWQREQEMVQRQPDEEVYEADDEDIPF